MMLKSVRIENYRSVKDEMLRCDRLTALVGANGSGKSSFLRAIELFSLEKPGLTEGDYYDGRTDDPIRITATFAGLPDSAKEQFGDYVLDDEITVTNILEWNDGKPKPSYHGTVLRNPDFDFIHVDGRDDVLRKYDELRRKDAYGDLPKCATKGAVKAIFSQWKTDHPDRCEKGLDDGTHFKHGRKFPEQFVQILYVTPVRDAAEDAQESRNSVLSRLMDRVVAGSLEADEDIRELKEDARKRYDELMRTTGRKKIRDLGRRIAGTVSDFAPEAKVDLSWGSTDLRIESKAEIKLEEDGYPSTVDGAGHGLQRILIMSLLQQLEEARAGEAEGDPGESPALVILIDEPELYQHPNRQRHMSEVLRSLVGEEGETARETQVIYSTHSPHFVGIDALDRVRLVRKEADGEDGPRVSRITDASLDDVARELSGIPGYRKETAQDLRRRLRIIMTPMMNEGFFANTIVLVEGDGDRAALTAVARSAGPTLESLGISVIPCHGKDSLPRPAEVFRQFKIPLYAMWDEDYPKQGSTLNREILSAIGQRPVERPLEVGDAYACLRDNLGDVIKRDFGGKFEKYRRECSKELRVPRKDVVKRPHAISYLIETAIHDGIRFPTLEDVVRRVIKMSRRASAHGRAKPRAG